MNTIIDKGITIAQAFPQTLALGISGSFVQNNTDKYSDYDFCIYTNEEIPNADLKKNIYAKMGISSFDYFNIDFEISNGDGFLIDDSECGFIWMEYKKSLNLLKELDIKWDLNEYLPGGVERLKILFETNNEITNLKNCIYYSEKRSINRFKLFINRAHHSIYILKWLEKAAYRNDYYSFLKNKFESIEYLIYSLFALNKRWMADEKRLLEISGELIYKPKNLENRLEEIIFHTNENKNLNQCLKNIKQLFIDTIDIFRNIYQSEKIDNIWL